ncbi:MAG: methionyl-tRNA formyltransferase [Actinomycetaceae bacterium]|nr:methionyl-tRNA formyltransferase [Actinomycetaceae bacterium]
MKVIFAGTPDVAVPTLEALNQSDHEIVAVLTRPPARRGRGRTLYPSAVGQWALEHNCPIIEASRLVDDEIHEQIANCGAELGVVVAYGAIIPASLLAAFPHGWINLHFSDLPRWRGAAPVQRAIEAGDTVTAINVFQLEEGLDTGPVFSSRPVTIPPDISGGELLLSLAQQGAHDVVDVVTAVEAGVARAVAQPSEGATYARMVSREELEINFSRSALEIHNQIRAWSPQPGAWTILPTGQRLKIFETLPVESTTQLLPGEVETTRRAVFVGTASGVLEICSVAPAGKARMKAVDWARGARLPEQTILGKKVKNA